MKTNKKKENKKIDGGKIAVRIVSCVLAALMVLSVAATLIYYIVK